MCASNRSKWSSGVGELACSAMQTSFGRCAPIWALRGAHRARAALIFDAMVLTTDATYRLGGASPKIRVSDYFFGFDIKYFNTT